MRARPIVPSGCRWDGIPERGHYQQWVSPERGGPGWHAYECPTDVQVLERMRARRASWLEALRARLPLSDPDRHDLDAADEAFAHLAPGYPGTCDPTDFAASDAAGYVTRAYDGDCAPEFAPRPVTDVETGGRL